MEADDERLDVEKSSYRFNRPSGLCFPAEASRVFRMHRSVHRLFAAGRATPEMARGGRRSHFDGSGIFWDI